MLYALPILLSSLTGYLALRLILRKAAPPLMLLIFLGASAGMGVSAFIVFSSLVILGQLVIGYVIALHLILLLALGSLTFFLIPAGQRLPLDEIKVSDVAGALVLAAFSIPVVIHAQLYPYGGWDAWSCWNLKARFILLGGEQWKNMFDPILWRSNVAYPLLVPALNVWGWCFAKNPLWLTPLINSCIITFITAGTLMFAIKKIAGRLHALLAPAWLLSIIFVVKLASSQYSDLMVGNYFLTSIVAFLYFQKTSARGWLVVMALALGALSFTKSEGLVLAIITALAVALLRALTAKTRAELKSETPVFLFALAVAFLPTMIFQAFFAPDSHTFINGFSSAVKPTSPERLKAVFVFFRMEIVSGKWNGFWALSLASLLLSWGKCFRKELLIIPVVLGVYLLSIIGVYWMNTFFEILWWLGSTLNRILFSLTPAVILWVFLSLE
jgi:hypothetical protein